MKLKHLTLKINFNSLNQIYNLLKRLPTIRDNTIQTQIDQSTTFTIIYSNNIQDNFFFNHLTPNIEINSTIISLNIWNTACYKTVNSFGKDIDSIILKSKNLIELFK